MKVRQLSVFLENKTGKINEMANVLKDANVSVSAFSVADSSDFGIMRLIVSDVDKAAEALRENKFAITITEVVCIKIDNKVGAMAELLDLLTENGIFIKYMYAFSIEESVYMAISPSDLEKCLATFKDSVYDVKL